MRIPTIRSMAHEHAQQQALFNSMIEGVLLLDSAGKIRLANQALERLFGLTSDVRGKSILEAFRLHELQELVSRALLDGQRVESDSRGSKLLTLFPRALKVRPPVGCGVSSVGCWVLGVRCRVAEEERRPASARAAGRL